jgi:hypothetical protein
VRVHPLEDLDDDAGHAEVPRLPVVARHDVPGRPGGVAPAQELIVGRGVLVPEVALVEIARVELPVLLGVVQPFEELLPLLLPRDVEVELEDRDMVLGQVALERVDLVVAPLPGCAPGPAARPRSGSG